MNEIAHSRLGASSAKRWLNCPASVALCEKVPYKSSSVYAEEGTMAHNLAELSLKKHVSPLEFIGKEINGLEISEEMAKHVDIYFKEIMSLARGEGRLLSIEERVHLAHIDESMFGTADAVIREHFGTLFVVDFKYGAGIAVHPYENEQLLYYALGAIGEDEYEHVEMIVIQPRADHKDGAVQKWRIPVEELKNFEAKLREGVKRLQTNPAHMKAGDWCHFCHARAICPLQKEMAKEVLRSDFEVEKMPDILELSPDQMKKIIENKTALKSWLDRVEEHATALLMNGHNIPGLKLVQGRGSRQWANEKEVKLRFGEKIYKREMFSVAQAEKAFGKDAVKDYVATVSGRPIAALESDNRKLYNPGAKADFAGIEE